MKEIFNSPIFFISLTVGFYFLYSFIYQKTKFALLNPLLLTSATIIIYLIITKTSNDVYQNDLIIVNAFLSPLIVCLAIPVYNRIHIVKQYLIPIIIGTVVGTLTSLASVYLLGHVFKLDNDIIISILPKSVTTPIAIEISTRLGGIKAITIFVVILTGILGALFGPLILKLIKTERSPVVGMSLGGTSHAIGTSKAVEISARAGAISSVAIVTSGILTTLITLFF